MMTPYQKDKIKVRCITYIVIGGYFLAILLFAF